MAKYNKARFRITQAPAARIPLPLEETCANAEPTLSGDSVVWEPVQKPQRSVKRSFIDLHFRLAGLNPSDDAGLRAWCEEHGRLGFQSDPDVTGLVDGLPAVFPFASEEGSTRLWRERERVLATPHAAFDWIFEETRLEYQCAAAVMRDALRVRRWAFEHRVPDAWSSPDWFWARPASLKDALAAVIGEMNSAIRVFFPEAEVIFPDDGESPGYRQITPLTGHPVWNLAMACLWNDLLEGGTYRDCGNETCGKPFLRQRGRAEHGQHRTEGIKYCSSACARAQAQRELRRRRRQNEAARPGD